ncbi:hypothetical protein ACQYWQ_19940 [Streptomyces sp. P6-2-1]|uniref:hypothetical protein n=1 Tax=unclassified Streptomyces TaxID=2593676 RepID=UPI003D3644D5
MPAHRRARRTAAALLLAALPLLGLTACDAAQKALDCVHTADTIADHVTNLQQSADSLGDDPLDPDAELAAIDKDLDALGKKAGDADLKQALDGLGKAVDAVRADVADGDKTPDLAPLTDAAGELTKVCTP